jgi:hypothetical protein
MTSPNPPSRWAKNTPDKEIVFNPIGEEGRGIEVDFAAIAAIRSGLVTANRLARKDVDFGLQPGTNGALRLNTQVALVALYGMNQFANEVSMTPNQLYTRRRTELAEAILQGAYGLRVPAEQAQDPNELLYAPDPTAVERLLHDEDFVRQLLSPDANIRAMLYEAEPQLTEGIIS